MENVINMLPINHVCKVLSVPFWQVLHNDRLQCAILKMKLLKTIQGLVILCPLSNWQVKLAGNHKFGTWDQWPYTKTLNVSFRYYDYHNTMSCHRMEFVYVNVIYGNLLLSYFKSLLQKCFIMPWQSFILSTHWTWKWKVITAHTLLLFPLIYSVLSSNKESLLYIYNIVK